jgi:hypothetical protein
VFTWDPTMPSTRARVLVRSMSCAECKNMWVSETGHAFRRAYRRMQAGWIHDRQADIVCVCVCTVCSVRHGQLLHHKRS